MQKLAKKLNQQFTSICMVTDLNMQGAYLCMGAYKCTVFVVTKIGAYIHGVLKYGCELFRFYGISHLEN